MRPTNSPSRWKQWVQPNRLIPLLTILGAGTAIVLSLFGVIILSVAENIVIALLALLAVDALTERLSVLERIETRIGGLSTGRILKPRAELPPIEWQASLASEICVVAISAISIAVPNLAFFERKVKDGCKIRVILLDPNGPSLQTWRLQSKITTTETNIKSTLGVFEELAQMDSTKGKLEIRLSKIFLPFSMFAVDLQKESGSMAVEFHGHKIKVDERPHVFLTAQDDLKWFNFYRRQFEQAWSDATTWTP